MSKSVSLLPDNPLHSRTLGCSRLTTCSLPRPVCGTLTLQTFDFPRLVSILSHLKLQAFFFFLKHLLSSRLYTPFSEVCLRLWR